MATKNIRLSIPDKVKAQLWVAAAGHCEFNCCNKRLDINILTQQKLFVGQHAHIIGDSIHGPRGNAELSKALSKDVSNLMLICRDCHVTIDSLPDDYDVELLRRMKKRHEERIQRLYELDETKSSLAIVLRHPIKRSHVPHFTNVDIQAAVLSNSDFCHTPSGHIIELDYRSRASRENDPTYWAELVKQMQDDFNRQMHLANGQGHAPAHLSIFAFAPMPLLMQLGVTIGNKIEASTMQWNRMTECWRYPQFRELEPQLISFEELPSANSGSLAVRFCLSGEIGLASVQAVVPNMPIVRFGVPNPTPALVESAEDIRHFRSQVTAFMAAVRNKGYQHLHIFPAMPLSLAVEFGRQLLTKVDPTIEAWDFQGAGFVHALSLNF